MLDLMVGVGVILVLLLLLKLLDYFDLFDIVDLFGAIARLVTGAIALLAALLLWSARKMIGANKNSEPARDEKPPAPRGRMGGRSFPRHGRRGPTA